MAALGEVPFGRYYGSCDATPLFVMLAHAYFERTGRPRSSSTGSGRTSCAALEWMETSGDLDGDGFIEYARQTDARAGPAGMEGLARLGLPRRRLDWPKRRSRCARCRATPTRRGTAPARLAALRGDARAADDWSARAERLRGAFERAFWCEELGTYALALDGHKRPCRVRTSNPGPLPVRRDRLARARRARVRHADGGCVVRRVGRAHRRRGRAALQPAVVPQRLDLAARQRDRRRRAGAVRLHRRGADAS